MYIIVDKCNESVGYSGWETGGGGADHLSTDQDRAQPAGRQPGAGDKAAGAQVRQIELRWGS